MRAELWDKIEVLLGTLWATTWELGEPQGNMLRTCWEHIENKEEKHTKKKLPPPHPEKENTGPIMCAC
jgi:hypothetical protein